MIKNVERMNKLIDAYESLLTNHQRDVIKMYYEDDFSLQEISEETSSSRSAVLDLIKRTEKILNDYESKLHLVEKEDSSCVLIMTTSDDIDVLNKIKETLVSERKAACCQLLDITSSYRWNNKVNNEKEKMLFVKTTRNKFDDVKEVMMNIHNYDVPEIVMLSLEDGNEKYFEWIEKEVGEE